MWIINRLQIRRWHLVLPFKTILSIHVFNGKNTHVLTISSYVPIWKVQVWYHNDVLQRRKQSTCVQYSKYQYMCWLTSWTYDTFTLIISSMRHSMTFMEFYWKSVLYGLECNIFIIFDVALTEAHDDYGSQGIRVVFRYTKAFVCIIMLVCN